MDRPSPAAPPSPDDRPSSDDTVVTATGDAVHSTSGTPRVLVPALDGFRGLAALTVVLYHTIYGAGLPSLGGLDNVLRAGYMGVDFFFVISGFGLFLPTVLAGGRFGNVRAYGIRRAARIIPAYYVALLAVLLLHPLLSTSDTPMPWEGRVGFASFVLHLGFLQHTLGLLRTYPEGFLVLGVVWTLTLEATFYVVLPFVASWYHRHPFVGFAVAFAASMAWKLTVVDASFTVDWLPATTSTELLRLILITQFPTFLAHFAAGMTAAWLFVRWRQTDQPWLPRVSVAVQIASVAVLLWGMRAAGLRDLRDTGGVYDHWTATLPMALAFAALMLATVLAPPWARSPFTNRAARGLGDISYGVYLWHTMVIAFAVMTLDFSFDGTTSAFVSLLAFVLAGAITLGTLSLLLVERPCIRWARRASRRIEKNERRNRGEGTEAVDAVTPANAW